MVNLAVGQNFNSLNCVNPVKNSVSFRSSFKEDEQQNAVKTKKDTKKMVKTGVTFALGGATGLSVLLFTRAKLGKCVYSIGDDIPKTIGGRIKMLMNAASIDSMTKLGNKKNLVTNVIRDYKTAVKNGDKFGIAMFDMDNFKGINELFGHDVGDTFLTRIAANINEVVEKHGGKAYRYGGEEFVVSKVGSDIDMKMISDEIAKKITSDSKIQDYFPKFQNKAKSEITILSDRIRNINNIFARLREDKNVSKTEVISVFEDYIENYDKHNTKGLKQVIEKIKSLKENMFTRDKLKDIPITSESTLSDELSSISSQYKYRRSDLCKWSDHLDTHQKFTISGGYCCLDGKKMADPKVSIQLVNIADEALQMSKLNGKNQSSQATDEMIIRNIMNLKK